MSVVSRLALPLLAGAALGVLAACGPGASPVAPEPVETEGAADIEPETEDLSVADENDDHRADNADEAHDHAHDGDEHDHDDDHAHAGGAAHVHGVADLALVLEGNSLTSEMISPLANFVLS